MQEIDFSGELEFAWRIYLSLESDIQKSFEFVEPLVDDNKNVASVHYQKIIFASCSEIDNLLKLLTDYWNLDPKRYDENKKDWNINLFYKVLSEKNILDQIKQEKIFLDYQLQKNLNSEYIIPFEKWEGDKPPSWWTAYNHIKHKRSEFFKKANLENSIYAASGLLVIIKASLMHFDAGLFSGTNLMHAAEMPRHATFYTGGGGGVVIDGGDYTK